jgi:hypothetical protein
VATFIGWLGTGTTAPIFSGKTPGMSDVRPAKLIDLYPGSQFRPYHLIEQIGLDRQGVGWPPRMGFNDFGRNPPILLI